MVTVYGIRLEFGMEEEAFARELYGRWEEFFRSGVEEVMEAVFSRYDGEDEVIRVGSLEVELGTVPQEEFYERFPKLLAERLETVFGELLRHREAYPVEIVSLRRDGLQALLYFLLQGVLPGNVPELYRDLHRLLELVTGSNGYELGAGLKRWGIKEEVRRRLVRQFRDEELEKVVEVTEPSEAVFIRVYTRSLIGAWPRLRRPEVASGDYRNVVWEVVWAYLLCEGRSFFSRKQLVRQTIAGLAARFNLGFSYLLGLLTNGVRRMVSGWLVMPELATILVEIREEVSVTGGERLRELMAEGTDAGEEVERWKRLLAHPDSCRRLLAPMREEEIYRLVEVVVPSEGPFVISYARTLEQGKERGMLEGKAGAEFRLLKWEFLFAVLLNFPASAFRRERFVWEVIRRIAVHYNTDPRTLLLYLCAEPAGLPPAVEEVLLRLLQAQTEEIPLRLAEASLYRELVAVETERLRYVLVHPQLARRLLGALPERTVYRLVRVLLPSEGGFVVLYARTLDREERAGMLEGKAGAEFRVLKWEFIFLVVLEAPASAFSRKGFVRSVLSRMAAHYNVSLRGLLDYFFRAIGTRRTDFTAGLVEVLAGLWKEEAGYAWEAEEKPLKELSVRWQGRPEGWRDLFWLIRYRKEVSAAVLEEAGEWFVLGLWERCGEAEVREFVRLHREAVRRFLGRSAVRWQRLAGRMRMVEGLTVFVSEVYGRKAVSEALREAGVKRMPEEILSEEEWWEAVEREEEETINGFLLWAPEFIRRISRGMPEGRRRLLERVLRKRTDWLCRWLECAGSPVLREVAGEIVRFWEGWAGNGDAGEWLAVLLPLVYGGFPDLSREEIFRYFFACRRVESDPERRKLLWKMAGKYVRLYPHWARWAEVSGENGEDVGFNNLRKMEKDVNNLSAGQFPDGQDRSPEGRKESGDELWKAETAQGEEVTFYVANAGVVLLSPYFPRLFSLLGWVKDGVFTGEEAQIRAIFAMQYLAFGQTEFPELELTLNKLLVSWRREEPLPLSVEFTKKETEVMDSLLEGAMGNWRMMEHTSVSGFRGSFLIRNGVMAETGELWQLTVEEKAYDVLLDSLPWNFSPVKFPWMEKVLYVNWRK